MKKKSTLPLLMTLSLSLPAVAEVHYLKKDESVSELLYNRLKITPIYRGGLLKKVLDENGISQEKSYKLKTGTPIKIGTEAAAVETAEAAEPVEPVVVPEESAVVETPSTRTYGGFAQLNAGMEYLTGNVEPSKFSTFYFLPQLKLGFETQSENYYQRLEGSVSYVSFSKDKYMRGSNSFFNPGLSYQLLKKFDSLQIGGKIAGDSSVLVVGNSIGDHYKLRNPFLLSVGPALNWQGDKILGEFALLYSPKQKVDSDNDMNYGLSTTASFLTPVTQNLKLGINLGYGISEIEKTQIQRASASAAARFSF